MREFTALGAIAALAGIVVAIERETHDALEKAAKLVEKEAKAEIGHYQEGAGPFASWAELADSTKDDRVQRGYAENEPGLRTGEMRDSIGHKVSGHEATVGSDDDKLVWFELGTERQPPRSVLAIAAIRKEKDVVEIIGEGAVIGLVGKDVFRGRIGIRD